MGDYNTFFSITSIVSFVLVLSRISGMIATAPLFSTFPVPDKVKIGLSWLFAFITFPFVAKMSNFILPHDILGLSILIAKETLVGILIGFTASLIFTGIQVGGQFMATQMGLAMSSSMDPVTKVNVPVVGQFYLYLASFIFISMNGLNILFSCVMNSYNTMPLGMDFSFATVLAPKIIVFSSQIFAIALSVVMPIFVTILLTEIGMAFMAKMAPSMNVFMVGLPVKVLLGLSMMALLLPNTGIHLNHLISNLLEQILQIFT